MMHVKEELQMFLTNTPILNSFLNRLGISKVILLLGLLIMVDLISGFFVAKLDKESTIWDKKLTDDLIRKGNMIFAIFSCFLFDLIMQFNLINFIPFNELLFSLGFKRFGLAETMSLGMIIGEIGIIARNWRKMDIRVPSFILNALENCEKLLFSEKKTIIRKRW